MVVVLILLGFLWKEGRASECLRVGEWKFHTTGPQRARERER